MAGPGRCGRPAQGSVEEQVILAQHERIRHLRDDLGYTFDEIARATGYHWNSVHRAYNRHKGEEGAKVPVGVHRARLLAEYEELADTLRPWITGRGRIESPPVSKDPLRDLLKILELEAKLLGTDAPKATHARFDMGIDVSASNESALETVEKWARLQEALRALGLDKPPGRPEPDPDDDIIEAEVVDVGGNGHVPINAPSGPDVDWDLQTVSSQLG